MILHSAEKLSSSESSVFIYVRGLPEALEASHWLNLHSYIDPVAFFRRGQLLKDRIPVTLAVEECVVD